jgi:hypothetical protein
VVEIVGNDLDRRPDGGRIEFVRQRQGVGNVGEWAADRTGKLMRPGGRLRSAVAQDEQRVVE